MARGVLRVQRDGAPVAGGGVREEGGLLLRAAEVDPHAGVPRLAPGERPIRADRAIDIVQDQRANGVDAELLFARQACQVGHALRQPDERLLRAALVVELRARLREPRVGDRVVGILRQPFFERDGGGVEGAATALAS